MTRFSGSQVEYDEQGFAKSQKHTVTRKGSSKNRGVPVTKVTSQHSPFHFIHCPSRWGFSEELGFYPVMGFLWLDQGVGKVTVDKEGNVSDAAAIQRKQDLGWEVIKVGDPRLGEGFRNFVDKCLVVDKHGNQYLHYHPFYEKIKPVGKTARVVTNWKQKRAFLDHLIDIGVIEPIDETIKADLITVQQRLVDRLEEQYYTNPSKPRLKDRYLTQYRRLELMTDGDIDSAESNASEMLDAIAKAKEDLEEKKAVKKLQALKDKQNKQAKGGKADE